MSKHKISELEDHIGFWLRYVSNHVSHSFAQLLDQEGVTLTDWVALRTLWNQQHTTHSTLIQALGITKGAASKLVGRLCAQGLVHKELVPGRAREQSLSLTPQGQNLVPHLAAFADRNDSHFFGHLSPEEQQQFQQTLQKLVEYHKFHQVPTH
jgi:DNA-binding MarR family transcriptional regulator